MLFTDWAEISKKLDYFRNFGENMQIFYGEKNFNKLWIRITHKHRLLREKWKAIVAVLLSKELWTLYFQLSQDFAYMKMHTSVWVPKYCDLYKHQNLNIGIPAVIFYRWIIGEFLKEIILRQERC